MKIPGFKKNTQKAPQQSVEQERLDEGLGRRRGLGGKGCGIVLLILILFIGSPFWWSTVKRNYTIRAQVSQGMTEAFRVRAAVEEYQKSHGELPANNEEAGLPPPNEISGKYVSQIAVEGGELVVVYGNKADEKIAGKTLLLVPDTSNSAEFSWTCTSVDIPDKWLTSMCQTP